MKALLDSATLIAAMLPDHVHHPDAYPWLARGKAGAFEFFVSGHSLAEVFSVLTRLPRTPRIGPADRASGRTEVCPADFVLWPNRCTAS